VAGNIPEKLRFLINGNSQSAKMKTFDRAISLAGFGCAAVVVLIAPWFFGAWEMWWFWPLAACLFAATAFFGLRLVVRSCTSAPDNETQAPGPDDVSNMKLSSIVLLSFIPFLSYALLRLIRAEVYMDAERSFLLFLTPFLLGVHIVFGFNRKQVKLLFFLVLCDLTLLTVYGLANHALDQSKHVLWVDGYETYVEAGRATGTYFCPDHFSGAMELTLCLAIGLLLARETRKPIKIWAALLVLGAVISIGLTQSRGGGLTVVVIGVVTLVFGFGQWPRYVRWHWRLAIGSIACLLLMAFCHFGDVYMSRFNSYFPWDKMQGKSKSEMTGILYQKLKRTARGKMISGALRAWNTQRTFGIGAGMHQNLWPHFAATPDGDAERGIRPTVLNNSWHSYEVHCDWVQLLEEYGLFGLLLLLAPTVAVTAALLTGLRRETQERRLNDWRATRLHYQATVLAGFLALVAMAFHSLGDFNLQMPATTWLLAALVAMAIARIVHPFPTADDQ
jgi:hypothetical protein